MRRRLSLAAQERQLEAQKKWHAENAHKVDRMTFAFEAGTRKKIQNLALRNGLSMTALMQALVNSEYDREFNKQ